jgi:hypothetical protein
MKQQIKSYSDVALMLMSIALIVLYLVDKTGYK